MCLQRIQFGFSALRAIYPAWALNDEYGVDFLILEGTLE